jgi:hypothetical protein
MAIPLTEDDLLPDHPEKYTSWSSLERKCLTPYFEELYKLRKQVKTLNNKATQSKD